jgi:hypothetical protein
MILIIIGGAVFLAFAIGLAVVMMREGEDTSRGEKKE